MEMTKVDDYKLLTISKAARMLGISSEDIKDLLLDPTLPRIVLGRGRVRLPRQALLNYLDKRSNEWYNF